MVITPHPATRASDAERDRLQDFKVLARSDLGKGHAPACEEAFPGVLNGGIIGALLDCHSNWCAALHLMEAEGADTPPCTVTADFHVKLTRPTPTPGPLELEAQVVASKGDRATVEAVLKAEGKVCATCTGSFVAVKPGHPARPADTGPRNPAGGRTRGPASGP